MLSYTHLKIENNPELVRKFKKAWWSSQYVQDRFIPYSCAKRGEIYGDFSPWPLHLTRSMLLSPLELRGIENKETGSIEIISSIRSGRLAITYLPILVVAMGWVVVYLQTGLSWDLGPSIAMMAIGIPLISIILGIRIRYWRQSLDQLIQAVHNKAQGID